MKFFFKNFLCLTILTAVSTGAAISCSDVSRVNAAPPKVAAPAGDFASLAH